MEKFIFNIKAVLNKEAAFEFIARLLAIKPHWDIDLTADGFKFQFDSTNNDFENNYAILQTITKRIENIFKIEKIDLKISNNEYLNEYLIEQKQINNIKFSNDLKISNSLLFTKKTWQINSFLEKNIYYFLNPPLGLPKIENCNLLIFDELFPISANIAKFYKANKVILFTNKYKKNLIENIAEDNKQKIEIYTDNFLKINNNFQNNWKNKFNIIIINLSCYLTNRYLEKIVNFLNEKNGKLIITGFYLGKQSSLLLKTSSKNNLTLINSTIENELGTFLLEKNKF